MKKTYCIVGASGRAYGMFAKTITDDFADVARLVGVCDPNGLRAKYFIDNACPGVPYYADFDAMIAECRPDVVIVTTVDAYHHEYIIRALDCGCDVITEKPMTIDEDKCNAILAAERRNNRKIRVSFNARFTPLAERVRELIADGAVGQIYHVGMEWLLDTRHGADYYRRWHRYKDKSGGLLIHKATHHFDMINWWIDQTPDTIFANGSKKFYGPTREERSERCLTCPHKNTCEFAFGQTNDPHLQGLYFIPEKEDGYFRDSCIFSPKIDIEDNMSLAVTYKEGALLTYSLVTYSPYEAFKVSFTGKDGRMEVVHYYSGIHSNTPEDKITVYNRRDEEVTYVIPKAAGAHGGGDMRILDLLFRPDAPDPLKQLASSEAGIHSVMIGVCANKSIKDGAAYRIDDLIKWSDD